MGQALFDEVFKNAKAMGIYKDFINAKDESSTLAIDTIEPRVLRLSWELLADEGGYVFAKRPSISVRRRLHKTTQLKLNQFDLPLRILMITARPEGAGFIDPRRSAAPLLDAVDELGDDVVVEFLRPPTLTALDDRLRDKTQPHVTFCISTGMAFTTRKLVWAFAFRGR